MDVWEKLVELLAGCPCESDCEGMVGSCPHRKNGNCNEIFKLSYCAVSKLAQHLITNGVTVQEWIPVSEPPKEKGTYIVCTDKGVVLLGHWYGKEWNVGGGAKKHLAYWMKKPQPPKGE